MLRTHVGIDISARCASLLVVTHRETKSQPNIFRGTDHDTSESRSHFHLFYMLYFQFRGIEITSCHSFFIYAFVVIVVG